MFLAKYLFISALYETSKFLTKILSPLQYKNGFSVANSTQFKNEIYNITIDDESMISFHVVSLFTAIPVDKACRYIRTKLENDPTLPDRTQLDIDDIIRLLSFCFIKQFFRLQQYYLQTNSWMCHGQPC